MTISSKELEKVFTESRKCILDYLTDGKTTNTKVKVALGALSNCTRLKASENNERQTKLAVLSQIAHDRNEYRTFVALTCPDIIPNKKLPASKPVKLGRPVKKAKKIKKGKK